jgi:hypothetical protein
MHIKEGVARGLCGSCSEAHITVDDRGGQMVWCKGLSYQSPQVVERPVHHCTGYEARNTGMDRHEAEKIGWVLEVKRKGSDIGFGFARPKPKKFDDD